MLSLPKLACFLSGLLVVSAQISKDPIGENEAYNDLHHFMDGLRSELCQICTTTCPKIHQDFTLVREMLKERDKNLAVQFEAVYQGLVRRSCTCNYCNPV